MPLVDKRVWPGVYGRCGKKTSGGLLLLKSYIITSCLKHRISFAMKEVHQLCYYGLRNSDATLKANGATGGKQEVRSRSMELEEVRNTDFSYILLLTSYF